MHVSKSHLLIWQSLHALDCFCAWLLVCDSSTLLAYLEGTQHASKQLLSLRMEQQPGLLPVAFVLCKPKPIVVCADPPPTPPYDQTIMTAILQELKFLHMQSASQGKICRSCKDVC